MSALNIRHAVTTVTYKLNNPFSSDGSVRHNLPEMRDNDNNVVTVRQRGQSTALHLLDDTTLCHTKGPVYDSAPIRWYHTVSYIPVYGSAPIRWYHTVSYKGASLQLWLLDDTTCVIHQSGSAPKGIPHCVIQRGQSTALHLLDDTTLCHTKGPVYDSAPIRWYHTVSYKGASLQLCT